MISINATLLLQVVHIIILILILNRLMFRPILKMTMERREYFRSSRDKIQEMEQETERLREEFMSVQRHARTEASHEASQIRGAGMAQAQGHIEETQRTVSSIREEAEKHAEKESEDTKPLLPGEAVTLADEIIERLMGRRLAG